MEQQLRDRRYSWLLQMSTRAHRPALPFLLVCTLLAGCSDDSGKATISGTVTLDGQPLKDGTIRFVPVDGQTPTAEAVITDGQFSVEVPHGEKQVSISSSKVVGKRQAYDAPDSPTVDMVEEVLPPRYNVQTELTITVAEENEPANFALTSR
jgi:hypothetical protein